MFILHKGEDIVMLLVYVDDIVVSGTSQGLLAEIKGFINAQFQIKDLGTLRYFLGLKIMRNSTGIFLNQHKYTLDLLEEFQMTGCKPSSCPMDTKHCLAISESTSLSDPLLYRRLVGKLIYLTISRPDLAYVIHIIN